MKKAIPVVFALLLLLTACNKNKDAGTSSLNGEWKLVSVKDKSTSTFYSEPISAPRHVIIKFSGNSFSGQTLVNTISGGSYTLQNGTDITFGSFAMTQVMEEQWGSMFLTVLTACGLQSIHPCLPSTITVQGNTMTIESALRYDVRLVRN